MHQLKILSQLNKVEKNVAEMDKEIFKNYFESQVILLELTFNEEKI